MYENVLVESVALLFMLQGNNPWVSCGIRGLFFWGAVRWISVCRDGDALRENQDAFVGIFLVLSLSGICL